MSSGQLCICRAWWKKYINPNNAASRLLHVGFQRLLCTTVGFPQWNRILKPASRLSIEGEIRVLFPKHDSHPLSTLCVPRQKLLENFSIIVVVVVQPCISRVRIMGDNWMVDQFVASCPWPWLKLLAVVPAGTWHLTGNFVRFVVIAVVSESWMKTRKSNCL